MGRFSGDILVCDLTDTSEGFSEWTVGNLKELLNENLELPHRLVRLSVFRRGVNEKTQSDVTGVGHHYREYHGKELRVTVQDELDQVLTKLALETAYKLYVQDIWSFPSAFARFPQFRRFFLNEIVHRQRGMTKGIGRLSEIINFSVLGKWCVFTLDQHYWMVRCCTNPNCVEHFQKLHATLMDGHVVSSAQSANLGEELRDLDRGLSDGPESSRGKDYDPDDVESDDPDDPPPRDAPK